MLLARNSLFFRLKWACGVFEVPANIKQNKPASTQNDPIRNPNTLRSTLIDSITRSSELLTSSPTGSSRIDGPPSQQELSTRYWRSSPCLLDLILSCQCIRYYRGKLGGNNCSMRHAWPSSPTLIFTLHLEIGYEVAWGIPITNYSSK